LDDDLKRITEAGVTDIPKELFTAIIEESREEQSRKKIMNHLRQCLTDVSKPKDWKRAYNAMVLAEELMHEAPLHLWPRLQLDATLISSSASLS